MIPDLLDPLILIQTYKLLKIKHLIALIKT